MTLRPLPLSLLSSAVGRNVISHCLAKTHSYSFYTCCNHVTAELKLPAWSDYQKKIQSQTYSFSPLVFTFPVEDVSLDLTEVDELVKQISSTPTHKKA